MQIYIDDLLIAMRGRPEERCKLLSMFLYTMRALGIMISLEKGRGTRVTWIGTQFVFETRKPENGRRITVGLPFKMCKEVYDTLVEWTGKGMIALKELRAITGRLHRGWQASSPGCDGPRQCSMRSSRTPCTTLRRARSLNEQKVATVIRGQRWGLWQ